MVNVDNKVVLVPVGISCWDFIVLFNIDAPWLLWSPNRKFNLLKKILEKKTSLMFTVECGTKLRSDWPRSTQQLKYCNAPYNSRSYNKQVLVYQNTSNLNKIAFNVNRMQSGTSKRLQFKSAQSCHQNRHDSSASQDKDFCCSSEEENGGKSCKEVKEKKWKRRIWAVTAKQTESCHI